VQLTELLYQRVKELVEGARSPCGPDTSRWSPKAAAIRPAILPRCSPRRRPAEALPRPERTPRIRAGIRRPGPDDKLPHRAVPRWGDPGAPEVRAWNTQVAFHGGRAGDRGVPAGPLRDPPSMRRLSSCWAPRNCLPAHARPRRSRSRRLEQELRITHEYEDAQDRLFRVQTRSRRLAARRRPCPTPREALASADAGCTVALDRRPDRRPGRRARGGRAGGPEAGHQMRRSAASANGPARTARSPRIRSG